MNKALRTIDKVSKAGGLLAAACIVLLVSLILVETLLRLLLDRSLFIAEEFSAYLMANFVMLGLAYTLGEGGHIRVNLLLSRMKGTSLQIFELAAFMAGCGIFVMLTWELWLLLFDNFITDQRSMNVTRVPIYLPQIGMVVGSALMTLQMAASAVKIIISLIAPKYT